MRDCCLLLADAVEAMTGHDPAADLFRYRYWNEAQARRLMLQMSAGGVAETVNMLTRDLGFQEIPPHAAQFGDIGLLAGKFGAVIEQNRHAFLFMDGRGSLVLPRTTLSQTWRV